MNTRIVFPRLLATGLVVAGLVSAVCQPATAGDLSTEYDGFLHSSTDPQAENSTFQITIDSFNNGKITGHVGSVPITGKIDSKFRFNFSGQDGLAKIKEGKAQFSAGGLYCIGSFKATGVFPGRYTFSVSGGSPLLGATPPAPTNGFANIGKLTAGYSGNSHHLQDINRSNEFLSIQVTNKKNNGDFTGVLSTVPITGHVDGKGKVTFKGGRGSGANVLKIKNGKAQLSAQGNYLLGSFQVTGTGVEAQYAGGYIFETVTII